MKLSTPGQVAPATGTAFKAWRLAAGLTQEVLAAKAREHGGSVTTGFVAQIEKGWRSPSPDNAEAICKALADAIDKPAVTHEAVFGALFVKAERKPRKAAA